jgi:peroxiredoxin
MLPHERSLVKKLENKPFVLLGVNSDDTREKLREVLKKEEITWPNFFDGGGTDGPIAKAWNVSGWPTIYVIDAKGVIRHKDLSGEKLEEAVDALVAEAERAGPAR